MGDMSTCRLDQRTHLSNEGYEDTFRWLLQSREGGGASIIRNLETSLACLYESLEEKIKATNYIYSLTRRTEWLATIAKHPSALGALARVLREEGRKSFNLRLNIVSIFFMMSFFPKFHQTLLEQKIGKTTLNILILEVQCMETRIQLEETAGTPARLNSANNTNASEISLMIQNTKQEKLLYMCISFLMNIAEDHNVEKRMKKCNLVEFLCKILVRKSIALLIITVTFLKKLSILKQNMDVMKENGIIYRLSVLIPCQHESLLLAVLRLLWNLSFDPGLRMDMVKCKVIQALEMLLKDKKFEHLVFGLLYNLSTDIEGRKAFLETDIGPMILQAMSDEPRQTISGELVALAVNLTTLSQISEIICRSQGLEKFIQRAIQFRDPLLFKVIKNISQSETARPQLIRSLPALIDVLKRADSCTFLQTEVMRIFNNMTSLGDILYELLEDKDLLQFFSAQVKSSLIEEEEVFLEIVIFVGAICSDRIAVKVAESGLVRRMCAYFLQKRRDSDIVLQLLWTMGQFLLYESTSKELFACDKAVVSILELSRDPNKVVARLAEILVNTIVEFDARWCAKLKWLKFASYNMDRYALSEDSVDLLSTDLLRDEDVHPRKGTRIEQSSRTTFHHRLNVL